MKKKRIIPSIAILMVLTAIMIALTGCTTSENPAPTVQNVYIKEDDNSSDNNAETKILVELEDEGETEIVILSVPNELFDKLGIEKKEKYTQATQEKVKAVLDVLVKEYNVNIRELSQPKSGAGNEVFTILDWIFWGVGLGVLVLAMLKIILACPQG